MIQYLPWSEKTLQTCINEAQKGMIPAIDLELTAKCSAASCIYCDSKPEVCSAINIEELPLEPTLKMLAQAVDKGLKWIYTCGLGEPLEDKRFSKILDFVEENNVSISLFTNGQFIENIEIAKRLKKGNVNIILKMDTFDDEKFDAILGGTGRAKKIYRAIDYLLEAGYTNIEDDECTDLAFSIVPTQWTKDTIPEVVEYCLNHRIFPSVGELEKAGNVISQNLDCVLGLDEDDLKNIRLKSELEKVDYMRPVCPAILTGLHIDNQGNCIVDTVTGFNCKWFLLANPDVRILGNVKELPISDLLNKVKKYREKCFKENIDMIDRYESINYVFGGCGGNPSEIIRLYKENFMNL